MEININDFRVVATLLSFVSFVCILAWTYMSKNRDRFESYGRLPFENDCIQSAHEDKR